ncbi:hypothetical protein VNO77_33253 [Canavalia gladiata]|uniref:Pentatricopeptide repeat-containing protein n=1 Tax=Canavalia gladiata TaxID=3824 RepID=A0AAN9KE07_CANGL
MKRILCYSAPSNSRCTYNYGYDIPRFCSFLILLLYLPPCPQSPRFYSLRQISRIFHSEHDAATVASFTHMLHMRRPPCVHEFNKVLGLLVKMKHYHTAISLYTEMELKGLCNSGGVLKALEFHHELVAKGFKFDEVIFMGHELGALSTQLAENTTQYLTSKGVILCWNRQSLQDMLDMRMTSISSKEIWINKDGRDGRHILKDCDLFCTGELYPM